MKVDSSREEIASRLRSAREAAGLSQGQVAKMLSIHRPTVSEIEAGRRRVAAEELARLAELYGVSIEWLVGDQAPSEQMEQALLAARELRSLSGEDLDRVVELIRSLNRRSGS